VDVLIKQKDRELWTRVVSPEKLCWLYRKGGHCALLIRVGMGQYSSYILFCKGKCPEFKEKKRGMS